MSACSCRADLCAASILKIYGIGSADIDIHIAGRSLAVRKPVHLICIVVISHWLDYIDSGIVCFFHKISCSSICTLTSCFIELIKFSVCRNHIHPSICRTSKCECLFSILKSGDICDFFQAYSIVCLTEFQFKQCIAAIIFSIAVCISCVIPSNGIQSVLGIIKCHIVKHFKSRCADRSILCQKRSAAPPGIIWSQHNNSTICGTLCDHITIYVLSGIVAYTGIISFIFQISKIRFLSAEPACRNHAAIKSFISVNAILIQLSRFCLPIPRHVT